MAYDTARGLGSIRDGEGEHRFHSTAITDASREIEVGTRVGFVLSAVHGGIFEATSVTKVTEACG
ncbi:MAG: hypothetical protein ACYDGN_05380 [Acidimicrobiales bacterium]